MKKMTVGIWDDNVRSFDKSFALQHFLESAKTSISIDQVMIVVDQKFRFCRRFYPEMMASIRLQKRAKTLQKSGYVFSRQELRAFVAPLWCLASRCYEYIEKTKRLAHQARHLKKQIHMATRRGNHQAVRSRCLLRGPYVWIIVWDFSPTLVKQAEFAQGRSGVHG